MPENYPTPESLQNTRVDAPHDTESGPLHGPQASHRSASSKQLDSELLSAIAGTDPAASARQLWSQARELTDYLQQKQELLDRRESEMNARLALFENEARIARLRSELRAGCLNDVDESFDVASTGATVACEQDSRDQLDCGIDLDESINADKTSTIAESSMRLADSKGPQIDFQPLQAEDDYVPQRPVSDQEIELRRTFADQGQTRSSTITAESSQHRSEPSDPAEEKSAEKLDRLNQALATQQRALEVRERQLQALHDQITELHRESLELRVATEHVWTDLRGQMPDEELAKSLAHHRAKLVDHYRLANDELCRRRKSLQDLQESLRHREEELRRERLDLQMWIDRQRNDLNSQLAAISAREYECERKEAELHRQAIQWQKQREEYRAEIERLSRRIRYTPVGV